MALHFHQTLPFFTLIIHLSCSLIFLSIIQLIHSIILQSSALIHHF
jgi:hypothetical protein